MYSMPNGVQDPGAEEEGSGGESGEDHSEAEEDEEIIEEEPDRPRGEVKICPVCHSEVDAEALFCNHCGAQL